LKFYKSRREDEHYPLIMTSRHYNHLLLIGVLFYYIPFVGLIMFILEIYEHFNNINEWNITSDHDDENQIITDADMYNDFPIVKNIRRVSVSPCRKKHRM